MVCRARQATSVSSYFHTASSGIGKITAEVEPRLAVGYHTIRQPELDMMMTEEVCKVYNGKLVIANDLMALRVTKELTIQREVVSAKRVQAPAPSVLQ